MQQVIDGLLKVEAEAQKMISQAQEEAQQIKTRVEVDYSIKLSEAREETRRTVLARVEQVRREIESANAAALEKAQAENDNRFREERQVIDTITDEVISLVMTPEYEREGE